MKSKLTVLILLFASIGINAQIINNLDVINSLLDRSVQSNSLGLEKEKPLFLTVVTPQSLEVLKPRIYKAFNNAGLILKSESEKSIASISYTLNSAKVDYMNPFSDGLFGGTLIERVVTVSGFLLVSKADKTVIPHEFNETFKDTLKMDDLRLIEQQSLPFTQSKIPTLPVLSGIWEPIMAVSTLIVSVILLFTIRSK